ncbi:MAG: metal-dependent transcriptional regulator [Fastidiosipila sp.]|nr:metal-dependent transcriptional regulator [Fastidiosipila sp.]
MRQKESREMYLETILKLEKEHGAVRSVDVADELGYSKPSVSRAMGVLKQAGYVSHSPYENIELTEKGRKRAKSVLRAHHLLTDFLVQVLHIDPEVAEEDACRIEHVISDVTLDAMEEYLETVPETVPGR